MSDTYVVNSSGKSIIIKDDQAILDYSFDWSLWLTPINDTISSISCSINNPSDDSLNIDSSSHSDMLAIIWLSGGTIGQEYQIECKITTVAGRTDERSIYVKIKDR